MLGTTMRASRLISSSSRGTMQPSIPRHVRNTSARAREGARCCLSTCSHSMAASDRDRQAQRSSCPGGGCRVNFAWGRSLPRAFTKSILDPSIGEQRRVLNGAVVRSGTVTATKTPDASDTVLLDVKGMKCGGCSASVKRVLGRNALVEQAAVNLLTETAAIKLRPGVDHTQAASELAAVITAQGFPSTVREQSKTMRDPGEVAEERERAVRKATIDVIVAWTLALVCCSHHIGHVLHFLGVHSLAHHPALMAMHNPWVSALTAAVALLGPGRSVLADGFRSLSKGNPNMNSLVGLGCTASFGAGAASLMVPGIGMEAGFLEEPAMLLAFVLLGRSLETRARAQAARDLQDLATLLPARAALVAGDGGDEEALLTAEVVDVPTSRVLEGDIVRVLPGERVPVDGQVLAGAAAADESLLTGEAALVPKGVGSRVTAGTVNYEGPLVIRALSTGENSTLAGIGRLVADAQSREAPVQRMADTVAGRFCFGVMAASALTFAFWASAGASLFPAVVPSAAAGASGSLLLATKLAVDVLVVACPCALGLATPTAVLVASSVGAKRGLLIRGGDVLEALSRVDTVVFDKTGTLTQGRMALAAVLLAKGGADSENEVLALAAAAEATTQHPVASALMAAARERGVPVTPGLGATTVPGKGVVATVNGERVAVGRLEWALEQVGSEGSGGAEAMALEARLEEALTGVSAGQTGVFVAVEGKGLAGAVALSDELRHDARWVVAEVQGRLGCRALVMSGDRPDTTEAIARLAGLPEGAGRGGMSPADKADEVAWLASEGRCVAVIGDGVNDAPAMARATVGVAMSGGLDAAGEAAGVVLMGDRLGQFVEAVDLSRAAAAKIRQNLAWALVYNTIGIPVAAGAALPAFGLVMDPAVAGGMMALSSLAVVSNSLLLRAQYAMKPARTGVPLGAAERGHGAGEGDANGSPSTAALKRA